MLIIDGVDNFEFEVLRIVLVCHVACDDALKEVFVDASGGDVVDDCFHALHEVIGVPVVAVMNEEPNPKSQSDTFVGVFEIMTGT